MVFEELGPSLYDWLRKNHYRGFSIEHIRSFGHQLIASLAGLPV